MATAIDWGNTNTVVGFTIGRSQHIYNDRGSPLVPSCMLYDDDGTLLAIGQEAKSRLREGRGTIVSGIKRLIGVGYSRENAEWARDVYGLIIHDDGGELKVQVGNVLKTPTEIAEEYFKALHDLLVQEARDRTTWLGRLLRGEGGIERCVVTCPVHYDDPHKEALRRSIAQAGFHLLDGRLVPEPAAACLLLPAKDRECTLVIDWGGGTLDYALVLADGKVANLDGIGRGCGGIDMDIAILNNLETAGRIPDDLDPVDRCVLREFIERMKEHVLSSDSPTTASEEMFLPSSRRRLKLELSQSEVVRWIGSICTRARSGVLNKLVDISGTWTVKRCVLVGGPVRSPYIQKKIRAVIPKDIPMSVLGNPMTAVARGALRLVLRASSPAQLTLAHDYGLMVDLLGHWMGPLLLRAGDPVPTVGDERELVVRGVPGTPVEISVWARKANPGEATHSYESSASFLFMPTFKNHEARLKVSLRVDRAGDVSARVVDATTGQQMQLRRVGAAISRPVAGPPCRSPQEIPGLLLARCWQLYRVVQQFSDSAEADLAEANERDVEEFIRNWVRRGQTPDAKDLWQRAQRIARQAIEAAEDIEDTSRRLADAAKSVRKQVDSSVRPTPARFTDLIRDLEDLFVELIRAYGARDVVPVLRAHPLCKSDDDFTRRVTELARVLDRFSAAQYGRLIACWGEIALAIELHDRGDPALTVFDNVRRVVLSLRLPLRHIEDQLPRARWENRQ